MLENYFLNHTPAGVTVEQNRRLLAVQAALEIAKASASSGSSASGGSMYNDLDSVASEIKKLADAIQIALEEKK